VPDDDPIGRQLAEWGKVALIETRGRISGRRVITAVGFVEEPGGALLVAAGSEVADWALNLLAQPRCSIAIGERRQACVAEHIEGVERSQALASLILKYGTPAERLGRGPVFRLRSSDQMASNDS
jgi:deazaflavin-dependent oxidoreductase (nitroreductase family)